MSFWDDLRSVAGLGIPEWAARSDEDVSVSDMSEALAKAGFGEPRVLAEATDEKPRAMFHDPYSVMDWGGWRQRPSQMTYETLREMSVGVSIVAAIINLRTHQVGAFCRPQQGRYDKGYRIQLRDRRDKDKGLSPAEEKEAQAIERVLETTGILLPDEKSSDRDSFRAFNKKAVRDILTYDQWCFEIQRDRRGRPSRFIALPSETIRPAVSDVEHFDPAELRSRVSHVQVYENTIIAEFGIDDIAWCVMNPRSDLRVNGFGFSPLEMMVRLVTAWLFGFAHNVNFFTNGAAIKGVLNIKGAIPDRQMRAFRRMWYSMVTGVGNAWKTPILNSEDIQWVSMHAANREMEYAAWMDWLTKIVCAIYGVDPVEINFVFSANGKNGSMFDQRPNQAEVTESKDKGLLPLLTHIEDNLNQKMIWELNPDFEFSFTGFDAKAEEKENERRAALVKAGLKTIDEARAEVDDPPMRGVLGQITTDPVHFQWVMAQQQGQQGQEGAPEAGSGGPPGAPAAGPGDDAGADFGGDAPEPGDEDDDLLSAPQRVQLDDDDHEDHDELLAASRSGLDQHRPIRRQAEGALRKAFRVIELYLPVEDE